MPDYPNPHDRFFRATFARRDVAADFPRHYLPPSVVEYLDLETLQAAKDSFVDEELREYFTDILYETRLKDGTLDRRCINANDCPNMESRRQRIRQAIDALGG